VMEMDVADGQERCIGKSSRDRFWVTIADEKSTK
jgi:hypothetical protein